MPKIKLNLRTIVAAALQLAAAAPVIIAAIKPALDALKKDKPAA
ncbi:hypothetical protein [Sphingomonas aracearum]|nr:hypothetical protein [Sphingomonas aracearum]